MKIIVKLIYFALLFMLFSCGKDSIKPEEEFTLKPGETKSFGTHSITFTKLKSDSRCPEMATCIRAGQAQVSVRLAHGDSLAHFDLVSGEVMKGQQTTVNWYDYTVELLDVNPYPKVNETYQEDDYSLQLIFYPAN